MITECPFCELNSAGEHAYNCLTRSFAKVVYHMPDSQNAPLGANFVISESDYTALRAERDSLLVSRELYRNLAIQYEKLLLRIREWDNNGNADGPWLTEWIDEVIGRFPKSEAE